jgi:hypothetical protein
MPQPNVLDCARCAVAAYNANATAGPGLFQAFYGDLASGFKGSYWRCVNPAGFDVICAFAGTETDTADDVLADIGFGAGIGPALGAAGAALGALGLRQLMDQFAGALELARQARWYAQQTRARLVITGHSLGGGLASMVACSLGVPAVTCNAPATSQLGFRAAAGTTVRNIAVDGDPINHTLNLGNRIGTTWLLRTGLSGGAAHSSANTVTALESGPYAPVGAMSAI